MPCVYPLSDGSIYLPVAHCQRAPTLGPQLATGGFSVKDLNIGRYSSVGPELVALPGMHLADPSVDRFDGQIVYLDFDGARDVTYDGPVLIEGIDVPRFRLPHAMAGQEEAAIDELVQKIEETFGDAGITVTTRPPTESNYSTIYIGGDDSAFQEYGSFLGLAEQSDAGNSDGGDSAFVFSDRILVGGCSGTLQDVIVHEMGHLLGYTHSRDDAGTVSELAGVAYTESVHAFMGEQMSHLYKAVFGVSSVPLEHESYLMDDNANALTSSGYSIIEGLKEEDATDVGIRSTNHFCAGGDGDELFDGLDVGGWINTPYENAQEYGLPTTISEYAVNDTASAYWWLGRTMHLIQDSCVPAHVHKDMHMGDPATGDDQYEKYVTPGVGSDYHNYFRFDVAANGASWSFQNWANWGNGWSTPAGVVILGSGSQALWDRSDDYASLSNLFRETTDYTDDYDSDDYDGDYHDGVSLDEFSLARLAEMERSDHGGWAGWVRRDWTRDLEPGEVSALARDVGTWSVEQSVMLMRFFYDAVGKVVASPTNMHFVGAGSSSVELRWDFVDGADGYIVYRSTDGNTGFSRVASSPEPSYTQEWDPDTDYYYRVYAYNNVAGLGSGYSSVSTTPVELVSTLIDEDDGDHSPGDLSLREALGLGASEPGKDEILFAPDMAGGTITLNAGLGPLRITSDLDLLGQGVTIDAVVQAARCTSIPR